MNCVYLRALMVMDTFYFQLMFIFAFFYVGMLEYFFSFGRLFNKYIVFTHINRETDMESAINRLVGFAKESPNFGLLTRRSTAICGHSERIYGLVQGSVASDQVLFGLCDFIMELTKKVGIGISDEKLSIIDLICELRNKLTVVIGNAYLTKQEWMLGRKESAKESAHMLFDTAQSSRIVVAKICRKISSALKKDGKIDANINSRIEDIIITALNLCRSSPTIGCDPYINAHPVRMVHQHEDILVKILLNIFRNAYRAIAEKIYEEKSCPSLKVRTEILSNSLFSVEIKDNGIGMASHILEDIFNEKKIFSGSGISLAHAKQTIEKNMKGQFHIASKLGEGTIVTLCLPYV